MSAPSTAAIVAEAKAQAQAEATPPGPKPSWLPIDLREARANADSGDRAPTVLTRKDDTPLFYRGCVNALIGESESGKSWVAMLGCAQELERGGTVVYIDFESDEIEVSDRLLVLGITEEVMYDRFQYLRPEEAADDLDLTQHLAADLVVIDGITEAMNLYGLNYLDNSEYATFHAALCKPLTRGGAAVVTIDHVTKSKDNRGNYAIGGQHKKAALDGTALIVEPVEAFGRGRHGWSRLTIAKDRRGYVRRHQAARGNIGTFHLNSLDDHHVEAWIEEPKQASDRQGGDWRPTLYMERVSKFLESMDDPQSGNAIAKNVKGSTDYIETARLQLVEEGYIAQESGPRNAVLHRLVTPFRDEDDAA